MNFVFALVAAGFMAGTGPIAEFIEVYRTEAECLEAKTVLDTVQWAPTVEVGGTGCIKITVVPGKPV